MLSILSILGGSPGAVIKAACLESREIAGSTPTMASKFQRKKLFLPRSLAMTKYCGEPL